MTKKEKPKKATLSQHNSIEMSKRPPAGVRCSAKGCLGSELRFAREDGQLALRAVICPRCLTVAQMYFAPVAKPVGQ